MKIFIKSASLPDDMIKIQKSGERGQTKLNWLDSRHSFSFGNYYNPSKMNFGLLRVLNDDIIGPSKGFGMHFHDNMEIVSIVLEGELEHKDSMSNHGIIPAGDAQRMSAGSGVRHSEFNPSRTKSGHFLQIWIDTKEKNIAPSYEQKTFPKKDRKNKLQLIACGDKEKDTIYMHQDARLLFGNFEISKIGAYKLSNKKHGAYLFVIDGKVKIENEILEKGDAAEITKVDSIKFEAKSDCEILLIEVPME